MGRWARKGRVREGTHSSMLHRGHHSLTTLQTPVTDPSTSSLSAAAATFAPVPTEPPSDVSSADIFAQTGAQQDDLFDNVLHSEESMRIRSDDDLFSDDFTPAPQPVVEEQPQIAAEPKGAGPKGAPPDGNSRGRGRGRGGRGTNDAQGRGDRQPQGSRNGNHRSQPSQPSLPEGAPTGPRKDTPQSVRGDRHATGGLRKPKLTEEELVEKMARISVKNASLTAAHARAEADAASFAEREHQAKQVSEQRRKEERRDRQQMMGEREKNRLRKLKAMEGREWDAEKNDDDFGRGGRFDKKGAFAGDQEEYTDGREYLYREPKGNDRGRGRGGRGGREGKTQVAPPRKEDFPSLPAVKQEKSGELESQVTADSSLKETGKSWAEQMESSAS